MCVAPEACHFVLISFNTYPGTWRLDHVGVKAPGNPISNTFLPLTRSLTLMRSGGNPNCSSTSAGMLSSTLMAAVQAERSPRKRACTKNFMVME